MRSESPSERQHSRLNTHDYVRNPLNPSGFWVQNVTAAGIRACARAAGVTHAAGRYRPALRHQPEDVSRRRAERHADADLSGEQDRQIRLHAVQPDDREHGRASSSTVCAHSALTKASIRRAEAVDWRSYKLLSIQMTGKIDTQRAPGEYIRRNVLPRGVSVTEAAERLGTGSPTLSNFLNRRRVGRRIRGTGRQGLLNRQPCDPQAPAVNAAIVQTTNHPRSLRVMSGQTPGDLLPRVVGRQRQGIVRNQVG